MGNGAQILDEFLAGHADAAVGNGDGFGLGINGHADLQRGVAFEDVLLGMLEMAQTSRSVGGIRHQFTQEDFPVECRGN